MFETTALDPTRKEDRTVTIFLNRACPRKCYQCGIADNSRASMRIEDWIRAFDLLHNVLGTTFFLFLGVEPLVLGEGFVTLVRALKERNLAAAWYTTSPEPMFSWYRQALVDAGIENWSSGVDTLPHLPALDPETDKKSKEALIGLKWMAERGVPTHVTTTIHKKNLRHIPEIAEWIYQELPGVEYAVNFIEWRKEPGVDFMSPPSEMRDMLWDNTLEEASLVQDTMAKLLRVVRSDPNRKFHTYEAYLTQAHRFYQRLDLHCQGAIGPSVDADGTMRLCGYHTGWESKAWNVLDLHGYAEEIKRAWERDLARCSGCYWACFRLPVEQMTNHAHPLNVIPNPDLLQIRKANS